MRSALPPVREQERTLAPWQTSFDGAQVERGGSGDVDANTKYVPTALIHFEDDAGVQSAGVFYE
jgi:hypothetical protein